MAIKLIITDFDGTLVDTFEANFRAYRQAFDECGLSLTREAYRNCFGFRFDRFMEAMRIDDGQTKMKIRELKSECYPLHFSHLNVNHSLLEFIRAFHRSGGMTAIASTAREKNLLNALHHIGADDDFDIILAGERVNKGKPDPEIYLSVLDKAGVKPSEAIIFEDSEVGFAAADASGIPHIKIDSSFFSHGN